MSSSSSLNRLDNQPDGAEATNEDDRRRERLQRVLARLSRVQDPTQQQSLYNWAPASDESDQGTARRRHVYRRPDSLRSAAIMHSARTLVQSPSASLRHSDDLAEQQDARSAYRRGYLAGAPSQDSTSSSSSSPSPSRPSALLESAVQYLDHVRTCSTYDESLCSALDHGLFAPEYHHDLITDTDTCPCPQPSSWLAPGAIFRGTQHTTTSPKDLRSSLRSPPVFDATRPWLSHVPNIPFPTLPLRDVQDRWPVKVTVQAVDHQNMTMAGTMEAFDVPNTTCPTTAEPCTPAAPITTYLEGQIIDLNIHTFLTPATAATASNPRSITFPPTSAMTDAAYWRNLPPFSSMRSDQDVARALLSRPQMEEIMSEWVFMRWKERCFIHSKSDPCHRHTEHTGEGDDTDTGHGLTISGFYYVSLRRSDGSIDGLYFDTKTSPYQHLRLEATSKGTYGAWQFK